MSSKLKIKYKNDLFQFTGRLFHKGIKNPGPNPRRRNPPSIQIPRISTQHTYYFIVVRVPLKPNIKHKVQSMTLVSFSIWSICFPPVWSWRAATQIGQNENRKDRKCCKPSAPRDVLN